MKAVVIIGVLAIISIPLTVGLSACLVKWSVRRANQKIGNAVSSFRKKLDI